MVSMHCWGCGKRWEIGTPRTCVCPDEEPKQEWIGLTADERREAWLSREAQTPTTFAEDIEAKLKEKNT